MQTQEFDKLFDEKQNPVQAFFPNLTNNDKLATIMQSLSKGTTEGVKNANDIVQENQTPISPAKIAEIRHFIHDQRQISTNERAIRRAVQRKFNITVIPE